MPKPGLKWWLGLALLVGAGAAWISTNSASPTSATGQIDKFYAALSHRDPPATIRGIFADMQKQVVPFGVDFLVPLPPWNDDTRREADAALTGIFTEQGVTGTLPRRPDGGFDWSWRGPNNDPEFAWFLNRQHHIPALFVAWRETRDARYRTAFNVQLRDWLAHNPPPGHYSLSSAWRALEVARRVEEAWMPVLFAPQAGEALDDDVLAGLLAAIPDHAAALRDAHSFSGNHLITEMTGLAAISLAFPDFHDAPQWLDYALAQSHAEAARDIYPDGAETELSNLYQQVVMQELQRLADLLSSSGHDKELAGLRPLLEQGWNFFAHTLDPRGHGPLNNDSSIGDDASLVRTMAAKYNRPDWLYIATNGREGAEPVGSPSEYFPYVGLAVMRSGWDANAEWAFFDVGPRGSDHQHADRLHLSIGGFGREFLVDDGRYNYQPGPWRDYFTGPRGHNVVLLDGKGTMSPPNTVNLPAQVRHEITKDGDFLEATAPFSGNALCGQGPAYHTRAVLYLQNNCWIVADRVLCAGPHQIETLWHFHPDCAVKRDGNLIYTDNPGQPNLGLLAVNPPARGWNVDLIRGRQTPTPQGWYSPTFNERVPETCVSFTSSLHAPTTTLWIVWIAPPAQKVTDLSPKVEVTEDNLAGLHLRMQWPGQNFHEVTIPLDASMSP